MLMYDETEIVEVAISATKEYLDEEGEEKLDNFLSTIKEITEWCICPMNGNLCQFTIFKDENYDKNLHKIKEFIESIVLCEPLWESDKHKWTKGGEGRRSI